MSIINSILSSNILTLFVVGILCYLLYYVHQYRKILLTVGILAVAGYIVYLQYTKNEVVQEIAQIKGEDEFNRRSLGYKLNNPGNIRVTSSMYVGEIQSDCAFKKFSTMKHGFRAMTHLLHTYINSGHNTISKIINRYCPYGDGNNNPDHYAASVARNSNVAVDYVLSDSDFRNGNMLNIMYAMTKVEQGYPPNIQDLADGFVMYQNEQHP